MINNEQVVFNSILRNPDILGKLTGIDGSFFTNKTNNKIIKLIKSGKHLVTDITAAFPEKDQAEINKYLMLCLADTVEIPITQLQDNVNEIRKEKINIEILKLIQKGAKSRTGIYEHEKVKSLYAEIEELDGKGKLGNLNLPISQGLDEVPDEDAEWLWKNYIPLEEITLINGDPDAGKGWLGIDWTCRVSQGGEWPDGAPGGEPANIFYMTYEDSASKIIKKRVRWVGGNIPNIKVLHSDYPLIVSLSTEEGREELEKEIIRIGNVRLWVIDPILDFTGSSDPNAAQIIRPILLPLIKIAKRQHLAIVLIGHLNKDQTKALMYRAGGSTSAWMGKARAAFLVAADKEDGSDNPTRYVEPLKNNYAWPRPRQMEFKIINNKPVFEPSNVDMNEVMNPTRGRPPVRAEDARRWLVTQFKNQDEIPSSEIERRRLLEKPCSKKTLQGVKEEVGIISDRLVDGSFVWRKK